VTPTPAKRDQRNSSLLSAKVARFNVTGELKDDQKRGPSPGTITNVNHSEGKVTVRFADNTLQANLPRDWVVEVRDKIRVQDFRSALGEDLTAIVLQFAMYDMEAIENLATDPTLGLAHLYRAGSFVRVTGVEVTGAGTAQMNGLYRRRENSEGPPTGWFDSSSWVHATQGRPWYEKDGGCYIYHDCDGTTAIFKGWGCRNKDGLTYYRVESSAALPPAQGWTKSWRGEGPAPAVSLHVS